MINKKYRAVFFDLDHTLWDYDKNAELTLKILFSNHLPVNKFDEEYLIKTFMMYNDKLWNKYDSGEIKQHDIQLQRFHHFLKHHKYHSDELALLMSTEYMRLGPNQTNLFPGTIEILEYLKRDYSLSVITNGFENSQHRKVSNSNLLPYFDFVITSEKVGIKKPDAGIFDYALKVSEVSKDEALMIGDNLRTDITGAVNAGIDAVHFDPNNTSPSSFAKHKITSLLELKNIL